MVVSSQQCYSLLLGAGETLQTVVFPQPMKEKGQNVIIFTYKKFKVTVY